METPKNRPHRTRYRVLWGSDGAWQEDGQRDQCRGEHDAGMLGIEKLQLHPPPGQETLEDLGVELPEKGHGQPQPSRQKEAPGRQPVGARQAVGDHDDQQGLEIVTGESWVLLHTVRQREMEVGESQHQVSQQGHTDQEGGIPPEAPAGGPDETDQEEQNQYRLRRLVDGFK